MYHRFVNRDSSAAYFVRKNACGQARHEFLYTGFVCAFVYVESHAHVSVEEICPGSHVVKQAADDGGEMNHVCRCIAFEYFLCPLKSEGRRPRY